MTVKRTHTIPYNEKFLLKNIPISIKLIFFTNYQKHYNILINYLLYVKINI